MLNCRQASRLISEAQERPLSLPEKISLKMHVLMCSGCKNFSLQVPFLSEAMRAYASGKNEESGTQ
ncbi:MAG: zf-HC2 domain-containing protein [Rhodoferax sp.]|uniref:zf-HC2 domain-containing protein n=1 Tax=Rhodoferax sp. TaxID=50421 RepID=UPI00260DE555|nr:zf-HC2 domain-containing protein [Rhodoferax sp.]MDD5336490.1 zf-HC2 domain-containing protein [Rhodoferax sp.]